MLSNVTVTSLYCAAVKAKYSTWICETYVYPGKDVQWKAIVCNIGIHNLYATYREIVLLLFCIFQVSFL